MTDIFEVQDDVTHRIVDALKVTLTPAEKERIADTETQSIGRLRLCLRGREIMLGKTKNLEMFEEAKKLLPQGSGDRPELFGGVCGSRLCLHVRLSEPLDRRSRRFAREAKKYARTGDENGPNEPLAHVVTGLVAIFEKDLEKASAEIDIAIKLNPKCRSPITCLATR